MLFSRNESDVVGTDDLLVFLFQNGKKMSVRSTGIQSGEVQYYISVEQLNSLATNKIDLLRFYTTEGYTDIKATTEKTVVSAIGDRFRVEPSDPEQIIRLSKIFIREYSTHNK